MDFRQYDNALGRFNGIDALAELSPNITPNHFGYNNPNYWNDPSGLSSSGALNSGNPWIDEMWNQTPSNSSTSWTNISGEDAADNI